MTRRFDVVTFDCYGTLIDWEGGIAAAFAGAGIDVPRRRILELHAKIEPRVQAGPWRPYREVLAETALEIAREVGRPIDRRRAAFLPESLADWPAFPDTVAALERLAGSGHRLAILSNVDDDLLAGTLRRLAVPFEFVVTAEQVRSYKPAPGHFHEARRRIDGRRWLHAAQSLFHDVAPARTEGIASAWVNRQGETRGDHPPDHEVPDLASLAELLAPRG